MHEPRRTTLATLALAAALCLALPEPAAGPAPELQLTRGRAPVFLI